MRARWLRGFCVPRSCAKRVEQRASRLQTGVAGTHRIRQHAFHSLKVRDPFAHVLQMRRREVADVGTAALAAICESEQRAHFVQGEAQFPRASHEAEASNIFACVLKPTTP